MWQCPACSRTFRRKNQPHSCRVIGVTSVFKKKPEYIYTLYKRIVKEVDELGEYREEAVAPDVIYFKTTSTFLALKVKNDHLEVEFFLEKTEDIPPVFKYLQTSKNRVAHMVCIDQPDEINHQLINWIKRSYQLIQKK